jgi:hypothetical protein
MSAISFALVSQALLIPPHPTKTIRRRFMIFGVCCLKLSGGKPITKPKFYDSGMRLITTAMRPFQTMLALGARLTKHLW